MAAKKKQLKKQTKSIKKKQKPAKKATEQRNSPLYDLLLIDADRICIQCGDHFFGRGNLCSYKCSRLHTARMKGLKPA